jgi:hypothetical protein
MHIVKIIPINNIESRTPGKTPAIKSFPIETSVCMPYTMSTILGGISMPKVPPAATVPAAKERS